MIRLLLCVIAVLVHRARLRFIREKAVPVRSNPSR
jgi:hypothetical protein